MKRYDLSRLMRKAWRLYHKAIRKAATTFSEALKAAWAWIKVQAANAAKVEAVADALGTYRGISQLGGLAEPRQDGNAR